MEKRKGSLKIFSHDHHEGRDDLAGEHPFGDAGQIIGFIVFLLIWAADSFFLNISTTLSEAVPVPIRLILAVPFFAFSVYLAYSGLRIVFGKIREKPRVIREGVFSFSRHPIYLSVLLLYAALFLTTLSLLSLVFLGVTFVFYNFIAAFEERLLEEKYGQEDREYKEKTRRWLWL